MWITKYEPKILDEMILEPKVRSVLSRSLKEYPNMMIVGKPGLGKSTFKNVFKRETDSVALEINCSAETGVDEVRDKIKRCAESAGFTGKIKVIVLEECDYMSKNAQAALRSLMDKVIDITRFMFLCNDDKKMMEPIKSRCQIVNINKPPKKDIGNFLYKILKTEKIKIEDEKDIVKLVNETYPDIRKSIVLLQQRVEGNKLPHSVFVE